MKRTALARSTKPMPRGKPLKKKRATSAAKLKAQATTLWGQYIHARDVVCQVCGKADGKLDAHHVMIRSFNSTRTDEGNGLLACFRCHGYFLHGTDPHKVVVFYTQRFGIEGYAALRQKAYDGINQRYGVDYWRGELERLGKLLEALDG